MTDHAHTALAEPWRRLWSGDLGLLDQIVADNVVVHAAPMGGGGSDRLEGRAALGSWIVAMHAVMADISFAVEIGPIADVDHLVLRWRARGLYRGGMLGVPDAAAGRSVDFTGIDILRVAGGRVVEYWVNSDTFLLMQQLG